MIPIAVSSMFFHEYPIQEILDLVSQVGADAIEFWVETPFFWLRGCPVEELVTAFEDHGNLRRILLHAPILDLNPCSINPRVAEASLAYALEAMEIAAHAGIELVTFHPGRRTVKRRPNAHDIGRFRRYIGVLEQASEEFDVKVSMENMEAELNAFFSTPVEVAELLEREPWLHFTLDVAHALHRKEGDPAAFIDLCAHRLENVHLSGRVHGVPHVPPSLDPRTWGILTMLRERGYNGSITLEIEDQAFIHELSGEERVVLLMQELAFARDLLQ
ncbi:MAG: sugar phosphate isomerase/epimerase family protein [Methanomicrobiales archaeon]|nr:sugar phosphate isomerase/epimerase family protein [Methanomicrobiales archaeon]